MRAMLAALALIAGLGAGATFGRTFWAQRDRLACAPVDWGYIEDAGRYTELSGGMVCYASDAVTWGKGR